MANGEEKELVRAQTSPQYLEVNPELTPPQQRKAHFEVLTKLETLSQMARNWQLWGIGKIFSTIKNEPETYYEEGEEVPNSTRKFGDVVGISHTQVRVAESLFKEYSREEFVDFHRHTLQTLQAAAEIPNRDERNQLLEKLLQEVQDGVISKQEAFEEVKKKLEEIKQLAKEDDVPEGGGTEVVQEKTAPLNQLSNKVLGAFKLLEQIEEEIGVDYVLIRQERTRMEGILENLQKGVEKAATILDIDDTR